MGACNIESVKTAFAEFEKDMTKSVAIDVLQDALDYATEIIEDDVTDDQGKRVAENLLNTYRRRLIERISAALNDAGSFEDDYYFHWTSLANLFMEAGYDEDKKFSHLRIDLLAKAINTWSKDERSVFLERIERDSGKH
jgi:hypothetical protein